MNNFKTAVLLTSLTMFFIFIGGALGGQGGMVMAFFFACIMNLVSYFFSDKIVLKMYKAQEATEKDFPNLYTLVKEISNNANLPMPKVYIINNYSPNAFATGRNPEHACIAFTTGILSLLQPDELKGVIGHELAHVKNRDILIASITATIAGAISMIASIARFGLIFGGMGGRDRNSRDSNPIGALILTILAPIAAMLIQFAISRSREFEADKNGAGFTHNPKYLANALKKLEQGVTNQPMQDINMATSHLFIVNPFRGGNFLKLFSTHPPMAERIEKLENMR